MPSPIDERGGPRPVRTLLGLAVLLAVSVALAQDGHRHPPADPGGPPAAFVASTAKPFPELIGDAMAVMDAGMRRAPMNGDPDHDFITMMIPHHQGAVDMARALLLYGRDPELRNLALGIIAEQHNEIRLMQAWLARHAAPRP